MADQPIENPFTEDRQEFERRVAEWEEPNLPDDATFAAVFGRRPTSPDDRFLKIVLKEQGQEMIQASLKRGESLEDYIAGYKKADENHREAVAILIKNEALHSRGFGSRPSSHQLENEASSPSQVASTPISVPLDNDMETAEQLCKVLVPDDLLCVAFFGRESINEIDKRAVDHFRESLLRAAVSRMAFGIQPWEFLTDFSQRCMNFPRALPAYPPGDKLLGVYDRFRTLLNESIQVVTEARVAQLSESEEDAFGVQGERVQGSVILGKDIQTQEPVSLDDGNRTRHLSIIGRTGYGKTTLLEHLILEDIRSGISAIVIDPHGDLSQRVISLASAEERERITLLEVWRKRPFRLNLLACSDLTEIDSTVDGILNLIHHLFDTGDAQIGHRLHRYFGNALRTLIPNGKTLADVQRLFDDPTFRAAMLQGVTNRKVHEFWHVFNQMPDRERFNQLESTINRLDEFLSAEAALAMVSSQETTIPLKEVLEQDGQILLIRIPVGRLKEPGTRFYGSLFLSLLADRLYARESLAESERHRLHLYLDEYGWFATSTTASLLQQARKYNLGATIAFQTLADLPGEKNKQAALQVGTFLIFRLTGRDADELVSAFPVIPREQTEETVMETVGTKPVLGPTQRPLSHLLANGHRNKDAVAVVQEFLKPLTEMQTQLAEAEAIRRPINYDSGIKNLTDLNLVHRPHAEDLRTALDLINKLLILAMERGRGATERTAEIATDIFILLGKYYQIPFGPCGPLGKGYSRPFAPYTDVPAFKPALCEHLREAAEATDPKHHIESTSLDQLPWVILKDQLAGVEQDPNYYGPSGGPRMSEVRRQLAEASTRLRTDAAALLTLCRILATDPIVVPTGQEQDDIRPRHIVHPGQTHADARVEMAGVLANLDRFTAYYQIDSAHGKVALAEQLEPQGIDEEAVRVVREHSKALYGRQLKPSVESPTPSSEPPPAPGPRVTRRPPER